MKPFETAPSSELNDELEELNSAAIELSEECKFEDAHKLWERHLHLTRLLFGDHDEKSINAMSPLIESHFALGNFESALALCRQAVQLGEQNSHISADANATLNQDLGNMLSINGFYGEAEVCLRRALAIRSRKCGPSHHETAAIVHDLGLLLMRADDYEGAEPLLRQAISSFDSSIEPVATHLAAATHTLGHLLYLKDEFDEAADLAWQAIKMREEMFGNEHPDIAMSARLLGEILCAQGNLLSAEQHVVRALNIQYRTSGLSPKQLAHTLFIYGDLLEQKNTEADNVSAIAVFKQLLELHEQIGELSRSHSTAYVHLARLLANQGLYAEAESLLVRALEILDSIGDVEAEKINFIQDTLTIVRNNKLHIKDTGN